MPIDHFPVHWRPPLQRVRSWFLTDAAALMVLALSALGHGIAYATLHTEITHPAEIWLDGRVWAGIWAIVGLVTLAGAVWSRSKVATLGAGAVLGLHSLWALSHLGGFLLYDFNRGAVGFIIYATTIALAFWSMWRGARTEIRIKEVLDGD